MSSSASQSVSVRSAIERTVSRLLETSSLPSAENAGLVLREDENNCSREISQDYGGVHVMFLPENASIESDDVQTRIALITESFERTLEKGSLGAHSYARISSTMEWNSEKSCRFIATAMYV